MSADRRDFLKAGAVAGATAVAANLIPGSVYAAAGGAIKVGVIGCGGRGSGAIGDCLTADKDTRLHAVGDFFPDHAQKALKGAKERFGDRVDVGERVFSGLNAYKQVIDSGADLIILATPPGFRPLHLEAAIKAGKHVFCEKPVAVDAPGIRKCLELVEESKKRNLAIVAGTQRRHQAGYIATIKQIVEDKAIGEVVSARCSWNNQGIWFRKRSANMSDVTYQVNNWYHFLWLCGDHIVEQHVHNLDVCNWVLGAHPVKAQAIGGRAYRQSGKPEDVGHIWDHFAVEYTYPNGVPMYSYCAHVPGVLTDVSETVYGTKGMSEVNRYTVNKKRVFSGKETNAYVQEHIDLIQSIKAGRPLNELQSVTESTMTAILGRMAAYSGEVVTWEKALASTKSTMPEGLTEDMALKVDPVPVPGKYKV